MKQIWRANLTSGQVAVIEVIAGALPVQVGGVPDRELVFVHVREVMIHVAVGVVRPCLCNIEVFNELDWVTTPHLLSWDEAAWWNDGSCE